MPPAQEPGNENDFAHRGGIVIGRNWGKIMVGGY